MIDESPNVEPLLLTAREAAALLHVSEKTLWNNTEPRGNCIPKVTFGKTLRYDPVVLKLWLKYKRKHFVTELRKQITGE